MDIVITLTKNDETMMKAIEAFIQSNGRTPKKREVVVRECLPRDFKGTLAERVFERLKLLGVVEHSLNGHCWLTPQGKQAMRLRYPASTIIEELTARIQRLDEADDHISVAILRERAQGFAHGLLLASAFTDELHEKVLQTINLAADRGLDNSDPDFIRKRKQTPSQWPVIQQCLQHINELLHEIHPETKK